MSGLSTAGAADHYDCVVVDDDPDICRLVTRVLSGMGVSSIGYQSTNALKHALASGQPSVVFLDVALGRSDAIEGIRVLEEGRFGGAVQLISGRDPELVGAVKTIGERHGLNMLEPLQKPFRSAHVRQIVDEAAARRWAGPLSADVQAGADPGREPQQVDLAEALAARWLDIAYQPKIDLRSRRVIGAEALARLNHPVHGELNPASFLPGAADTVLLDLAELAIRKAFLDWRIMAESGCDLQLAVNVPVRALLDSRLTEIARDAPRDAGWPGLVIEVTESQAVKELEAVSEAATQLRIYNVSLAIDDFGSGYSSFARLKQLPFSELKLDRSYVQNCAVDPLNAGICRSVIELARVSGAASVAEGVETKQDWAALMEMRCDIGQGFYFGRPMSVGKLIAHVGAN